MDIATMMSIQSNIIMFTYLAILFGVIIYLFDRSRWPIRCQIVEWTGSGKLGQKDKARIVTVKKDGKQWQEWRFAKNKQFNGIIPIPSGDSIIPFQGMFKPKSAIFAKTPKGNLIALKIQFSEEDEQAIITFDMYSAEAMKSVLVNVYDKIERTYNSNKAMVTTALAIVGMVIISVIFVALMVMTASKSPQTVVQTVQAVNQTVSNGGGIGSILHI